MRGDNIFIYQNIIIHYKYLHNNLRTFVEFLDRSIYALFCPAPRISTSAPQENAPRPSLGPSIDKKLCCIELSSDEMKCIVVRKKLFACGDVFNVH